MPKKIDWLYARKHCDTCKKARAHMESAEIRVGEEVDGTKLKISPEEALKLLEGLSKVVAVKGKSLVTFDLKKDRPEDEVILAKIIGPFGYLRAPTARVGKTLIVGFTPEVYQEWLG